MQLLYNQSGLYKKSEFREKTDCILVPLFVLLFFLGFSYNSYSQCPTVNDPVQSFCDVESILVIDLMATDNGDGVLWYDTPTSTTPLSPTDGLEDGEDYYADDNSGSCIDRPRVDVIIYGAPIGSPFQGVCVEDLSDATLADLEAIGNDVQWYSQSIGGSPLPLTTQITDNTIYYADQASPDTGCRTSRLSVQVSIGLVPTPVGDSNQTFCNDPDNPPTVGDLAASGNIIWYATSSSFLPLDDDVLLEDNEDYFAATSDPPCESDNRLRVRVKLDSPNDSGISGEILICDNEVVSTGTVRLIDGLVGAPANNGNWSGPFPTNGGGNGIVDITSMTVQGSPYVFTYTVDSPSTICPPSSSTVSVSIIEGPDAGEDANIDTCSNDSPFDLFQVINGTPEPGGTWSPLLNSGTNIFDPSVDPAGDYIYTVDGNSPCQPATSTVTVTITEEPDGGEDGAITLCTNDSSTDLFNELGGNPDVGGTWSPDLNSGTGVFDPTIDSAGVYTYTVSGTGPCGPDSATVTVSLIPEPNAGSDGFVEICSNGSPLDLFGALGQNPDTGGSWTPSLNSGTGVFDPSIDSAGVYIYTVNGTPPCGPDSASVTVTIINEPNAGENGTIDLCTNDTSIDLFNELGGSPDAGGMWSPTLNSGTGLFDPSIDSEGVYTYTVSGTSPCNPDSATVTVSIIAEPMAGENGAIDLCSNNAPVDLFNSLGPNAEQGGLWSPPLNSGSGVFDPSIDTAGVYTYTVDGNTPCGPDSAQVTVTITEEPVAGEDGSVQLCSDDGSINLFDSLNGSPEPGGTWNPSLASGTGVFDPQIDQEGDYTYTVLGNGPCEDDTAIVSVSVFDEPNAGNNSSVELCSNDNPIDLFNVLQGNPDSNGTWTPLLNSGTGILDPSIDTAGTYTYTVSGQGPCGDSTSEVSVSIVDAPNAGNDGTLSVCESDPPIDLFNSISGNPDLGGTWSPPLVSGTGVFDPNTDSEGSYTYTVIGSDPCNDDTATVTVTLLTTFNAGTDGSAVVCSDDDPIDLFGLLGNNPDNGGTWSPSLNSGTGIFDPTIDGEGIYTYTIGTNSGCGESSSEVNITIIDAPNPGMDSSLSICADEQPIDLFDILNGNPESGGEWTPALNSGSGIFDPSIDSAGDYQYTVMGNDPCEDKSAIVSVSILSEPNSGVSTTIDLCSDNAPVNLFDILGGNPDTGGNWSPTLSSGTGILDPAVDPEGVYTYTVGDENVCGLSSTDITVTIVASPNPGINGSASICTSDDPVDLFTFLGGNPESGGTWIPSLTSGSGVFDPTLDSEGTYTYTLTGNSPCDNQSADVIVTLVENFNPGTNGSVQLCSNDDPIDLFSLLGNDPDTGGSWSPILNSGSGVFDPSIDSEGTYIYTISGSGSCASVSSEVVVTVLMGPNAGIDSSVGICIYDDPTDLFNSLGGNPDSGGVWSPALNSGSGVFDPEVDSPGDYTYTVTDDDNCNNPASATVTVTISERPNPSGGVLSASSLCFGEGGDFVISGANQLEDGDYLIDYEITGENEGSNSIVVTFNNGIAIFTIPDEELANFGDSTLTISGLTSQSSSCFTIETDIAPLEFTIFNIVAPELVEDGENFCEFDEPTVASLTENIVGDDIVFWYETEEGTSPLDDTELLVDGRTYYGGFETTTCKNPLLIEVTVNFIDCEKEIIIPDGFSPNGDNINDTFRIVNLRDFYPDFKLEIYNRYGNMLYKGDISDEDWDGRSETSSTIGDSTLPTGVYFFILYFNDGERDALQGRVYLSR